MYTAECSPLEMQSNMAAPTLSDSGIATKGGKQKNKGDKSSQSGERKVTRKNILCPPFQFQWPAVDVSTEDTILTALAQKLQEFPQLEKGNVKGIKKTDDDGKDATAADEDADDLVRARLRQQLMIGHRQVVKGLERDQLGLVLVWGGAQPPFMLQSLLPLAASRACPALCLKDLVPRITEATGLSSLMALGFKKSQPGLDDFAEFVTMAASLALPLSTPGRSGERSQVTDVEVTEDREEKEGGDEQGVVDTDTDTDAATSTAKHQENIDWPVVTEEQETQLIKELMGLLEPYKSAFKKPKPRLMTKEWKSCRVMIRSCLITDASTLWHTAKNGGLELLLVQHDVSCPNTTLTSMVRSAVQKSCPVLQLRTLKKNISRLVRNPLLRAVGFRKPKDTTQKQPKEFTEFVTFASQYVPPDLHMLLPAEERPREDTSSQKSKTAGPDVKNKPRPKKTPIPFYDVSHLYVYKTDPVVTTDSPTDSTEETASKKRKVTLSVETESYISLSSKPTVQILGLKPTTDRAGESSEGFLFLDTTGSGFSAKKQKTTGKTPAGKDETSTKKMDSGSSFQGVFGLDTTDAPSAPAPFYPQPEKAGSKAKLKRKLDQSADKGEFVSFRLTPTNVQTSVSNPNKVKKDRRKKKKR